MNIAVTERQRAPRCAMEVQPLYFKIGVESVLGWWHPGRVLAPLAVVICAPFGLEDLSAYRSLRELAYALAAAGLPTLRFDYPGCGDSAGDNDEGDRLGPWLGSINTAADLARSLSGADRLVFIGVRLGALLAATAAASRGDVAALVAIAPIPNGRAFVRECRMLGGAAGVASTLVDGGTQAAGFVINGPTCESLSQLTLDRLDSAPAPVALVIHRDDMPPTKWPQLLTSHGMEVESDTLPGFAEMIDSPHFAITPMAIVDRVVNWMTERRDELLSQEAITAFPIEPARSVAVVNVLEFVTRADVRVREQAIRLGDSPSLVGQLTEPVSPSDAPLCAILILNTGGERRVGPNRLWVPFARERASRGELVMRLDQAGVGESDLRPGAMENDIYSAHVLHDVAEALRWLRTNRSVSHCTLMGVCSGAYHSFDAARAGLAVDRIVSINQLLFHWHSGISLRDTATHPGGQLEHLSNAVRGLRSLEKWQQLFRGRIDVAGLARVIWARGQRRLRLLQRAFMRTAGMRMPEDLPSELRAIANRGIAMEFVFSEGDPGQTILAEESGHVGKLLKQQGALGIKLIKDADHTFTSVDSRRRLSELLHTTLDAGHLSAESSEPAHRL